MNYLSDGGVNMSVQILNAFIIGAIVGCILTGLALCILCASSEGDNNAEE
jgi:hypothetical protein